MEDNGHEDKNAESDELDNEPVENNILTKVEFGRFTCYSKKDTTCQLLSRSSESIGGVEYGKRNQESYNEETYDIRSNKDSG